MTNQNQASLPWYEWPHDDIVGPQHTGTVYTDGWTDNTSGLPETIAQLGWMPMSIARQMATPYALHVGHYGYLEGESDPVLCSDTGETADGDYVEVVLKMTFCPVPSV